MASIFFGFNPPFFREGGPVMPVQTDERLVKNDLLQLLLTVPGERAFRPDFGTELRRTTFEPQDRLTIDTLRRGILEAIRTFEPRVQVTELLIERVLDDTQLEVKIRSFIINDPSIQFVLELRVPVGTPVTPAPPNQVAT
jgi:phage baseplate assembly protein W